MPGWLLLITETGFGLVVTFLFCLLFRSAANRFPVLRSKRNLTVNRWSAVHRPNVGGAAFIIMLLFGAVYVGGTAELTFSSKWVHALISATAAGLFGLYDDHFNISPRLKLAGQAICATLLYVGGAKINLFDVPCVDFCLTYLWIIGLMNSLNMLDNMDGITGGTSAGISVYFMMLGIFLFGFEAPTVRLTAIVTGSIIGFLFLNFPKARIFMGDKGSQLLGLWLAFLSIEYLWNPATGKSVDWFQTLITVGFPFIIPLTDTLFVTLTRLRAGKSPASGGRDHTTHHWSYAGWSEKKIAYGYLIGTLAGCAISAFMLFYQPKTDALLVMVIILVLCFHFAFFIYGYRTGSRKKNAKGQGTNNNPSLV